ncbi:MAG TPA: Hsp20/alpha crystallin family protein [Longimicrobiales bacterium]|nr:Hsp20/alpha crystallin family protein [Longimicrobiales bacterium]
MMIPTVWTRGTAATPFEALYGVRRQLDRLFDEFSTGADDTGWSMPAEVVETQDELRFHMEVPGLRPEDIELTVENGILTVAGEKKLERREGETDDNYRLVERRYGRYSRSFRLPSTVAPDRVQASCENGVLTIRLPKAEEAKPRRIQVTGGDGAQSLTQGESSR